MTARQRELGTSHAYSRSGTYTVTVTVLANCTSDRATGTLIVTIG